MSLALLASGCDVYPSHYGVRQEAALEKVIKPKMRGVARRVLYFAGAHPRMSDTSVGDGVVDVVVRGNRSLYGNTKESNVEMEVATKSIPGTSKPNLDELLAVSLFTASREAGRYRFNSSRSVDLYAPGGLDAGIIGGFNNHPDGWSAQMTESHGFNSVTTVTSDSSDSMFFTPGPLFLTEGNALDTAKTIVGETRGIFNEAATSLAPKQTATADP